MDFARAGVAKHLDDLARRRTANDRVVDDDKALSLDVLAQWIELRRTVAARLFWSGEMNVRPM